jgi:hypothetical protein
VAFVQDVARAAHLLLAPSSAISRSNCSLVYRADSSLGCLDPSGAGGRHVALHSFSFENRSSGDLQSLTPSLPAFRHAVNSTVVAGFRP